MDRRIPDHPQRASSLPVAVEFDGETYPAYAGEPLAVALYAAGVTTLSRSIKYHRPRGLFCLSGHCGACLVRVDELPNVRACTEPCRDGLAASGQNAFPSSDLDVMAVVDWFFRKGMDHHTLLTGPRVLNQVMQKFVRRLSGLGKLPDRPTSELPPVGERDVDVVVVGAGPAGLAAAAAAAEAGARTLCVDEQARPGGSLLAQPGLGPAAAEARAREARAAGAEIMEQATVLSWFPEDGPHGLLGVATPEQLLHVTARRYVYATGGYDVNLLFEDNDLPGVIAARAAGRLLALHGVLPGAQVAVVGQAEYASVLVSALEAAGAVAIRVEGALVRARGHGRVDGIDLADGRRLRCDAVAVAALPAPASEAPRSHGARVELSPARGGFAVLVDEEGRTSQPGVFACGDVTGYLGPEAAATSGARAGAAAAREALS